MLTTGLHLGPVVTDAYSANLRDLSATAFAIATRQPEACDSRSHFIQTGRAHRVDDGGSCIIGDDRCARYIDGTAYASVDRTLADHITDPNHAVLTARRRWPQSLVGVCFTTMGGDWVTRGWSELNECTVLLSVPRQFGGNRAAADPWCVVFTGAVMSIGTDSGPHEALRDFTVYPSGSMCSLTVEPSVDHDGDGYLRHRLLFEGCGYQARAVPDDVANTYYLVYWSADRDMPMIHLHVKKAIARVTEVTRPDSLQAPCTFTWIPCRVELPG
jgi:hypothetical protein